jgi:hypothetical protein
MDWSSSEEDPFAHLLQNHQRPFYTRRTQTEGQADELVTASPTSTVVMSPQTMSPTSSPIHTASETNPLLPASAHPRSSYTEGPRAGRNRNGTFPLNFGNWRDQYESKASAAQASGVIYDAMQRWGLEYEPVSELDTASSAYSAAFWDKNSNWVVVAFKGRLQ